jgi:hypothetical protein
MDGTFSFLYRGALYAIIESAMNESKTLMPSQSLKNNVGNWGCAIDIQEA